MERVTNFAGIPSAARETVASAGVVFLPAPFEGTVSYGGGTSRGPQAILEASTQVETFDDETGVQLEDLSFATDSVIEAESTSSADYTRKVERRCLDVLARGALPFVLGGEHSVSIGAIRAARTQGPVHVLSIDAHADLRDEYEGDDHSHACVCRRAIEHGPVSIVGVRSYSAEEADFVREAGPELRLVPAREANASSFDVEDWVGHLGPRVYLTFDVDGLDPSVVPGTGTPEPGGLSWDRALEIVRAVLERRQVVGLDVVELAPIVGAHVSEFATARLVAKMLSYLGRTSGTVHEGE